MSQTWIEHDYTSRTLQIMRAGGIGDMRLHGDHWVFNPKNSPSRNISLGLGIQIPTASTTSSITPIAQSVCTARLNHVVRQSRQFSAAAEGDKLFRLPTGDGMVLVFFTNLEAPVRCAIEIATALKGACAFGLRMGIHSGPVNKIFDVNDRANLAGSRINIAQRVVDSGDAGHILLSKRVAEDLEQSSQWQSFLHDLGECEVKHGVRITLVSLYNDEIGNAAIPGKIARAHERKSGGLQSIAVKPLDNSPAIRRRNILPTA